MLKLLVFLAVIASFEFCDSKKNTNEYLLGQCEGDYENSKVKVDFLESKEYIETYSDVDTTYFLKATYAVVKDTLIIYRQDEVEKHIIKLSDNNALILETLYPYKKDIPIINGMKFRKYTN